MNTSTHKYVGIYICKHMHVSRRIIDYIGFLLSKWIFAGNHISHRHWSIKNRKESKGDHILICFKSVKDPKSNDRKKHKFSKFKYCNRKFYNILNSRFCFKPNLPAYTILSTTLHTLISLINKLPMFLYETEIWCV